MVLATYALPLVMLPCRSAARVVAALLALTVVAPLTAPLAIGFLASWIGRTMAGHDRCQSVCALCRIGVDRLAWASAGARRAFAQRMAARRPQGTWLADWRKSL
ncbi:hypothetical protein GGQ80_002362 [Sphingomonas jinjuensis]|uniref:Uncharacterized protein n=1 Tax=Sphingomonas jinjuensis TaxID=535907 RepID=A0A840F9V6_9SPHN|nr:hypothetical protein [Sphingomonas jinjuensis]